jgi:hypothetical protein
MIDLQRASVPLVAVKRKMNLERLVKARAVLNRRPSWLPTIAKAFCIVARDQACLRTFYLRWPWPHFYEVPRSVAMAALVHDDFDPDAPVILKIGVADEMSLTDLDALMQHAKNASLDEIASFKRILRITRMPLPLRRLMWSVGLNCGRFRANHFGTFAITSVASLGVETVVARGPGPAMITYGQIHPDHTMELLLHWDHRMYDGVMAARALHRLEEVLNGEIADELLAGGARSARRVS